MQHVKAPESAHEGAQEGHGFKGQVQKKKRGPPENGVPSATKIMVANLPYELSEEKVVFVPQDLHGPPLTPL